MMMYNSFMAMIQFPFLPCPVNQRYLSRRFILSSKYRQSLADIKRSIPPKTKVVDYPVFLDIIFFYSRDRDVDSGLKCLLDAFTGSVFVDDAQVIELRVQKIKVPKKAVRTSVIYGYKTEFGSDYDVNRDLLCTDTHDILVSP